MTELIAKPIVKNKYWIVENEGNKIATIQAVDGEFVYVNSNKRQRYASIKLLASDHNIVLDKAAKSAKPAKTKDVYGYPADCIPHNVLWDVKHQFPVFTKDNKSKSFYCAGYYNVKQGSTWEVQHCPKLITLNRYDYTGPFKTLKEAERNGK